MKFEELGMIPVGKSRTGNSGADNGVTLTYNRNRREVYISIDSAMLKIAFKDVAGIKLLPILDCRRNRLYLVNDPKGYTIRGDYASKKSKPNFTSRPLYFEFAKHNFTHATNGELIWDENLHAYYIEIA